MSDNRQDARNILFYFSEGKEQGKTPTELWKQLTHIDMEWGAYGDYHYYKDSNGNMWFDFVSIGD